MKNLKAKALILASSILNFIGAILLAFSLKVVDLIEEYGAGMSLEFPGETINQTQTIINGPLFHWGMWFLVLGFLFQIMDILKKG